MNIAVLGIDLGKNSCIVVGLDDRGRVVLRRRVHRGQPDQARVVVAVLRHGDGGVLWGAPPRPRSMGREVRLMSPEYVRPYVKAQENDDRDAEAIAEAATRRRCTLLS